jgi:hypothetical protein
MSVASDVVIGKLLLESLQRHVLIDPRTSYSTVSYQIMDKLQVIPYKKVIVSTP